MDLNNLEIPDTLSVHIQFKGEKLYSDNDKKKPVVIELYSPAADAVIDYKKAVQRKTMLKLKKSRTNSLDLTPEEIEEQNIDRLVAFTCDVKNIEFNGEKITSKNIRTVYANPKYGWLTDQLTERLNGWDDF